MVEGDGSREGKEIEWKKEEKERERRGKERNDLVK